MWVVMTVTWPVLELLDPHDPDITVWARIRFDLDLATLSDARRHLRAICATAVSDHLVVVEFAPGRFVAVCGLRLLLEGAESVRLRGGEFAVMRPPPSLRRMHAVFELGSALPMIDRPGDAPTRLLPADARRHRPSPPSGPARRPRRNGAARVP
jgi:anti-anti-sigma regulatory factor